MSPKIQRIIGWVLSGLLAAFLIVGSGVPKLMESSDPEMKKAMDEILTKMGWSADTIKIIGVIEIVITLLFVIPRTGFVGAILITGYLGGAIATHVRIGDAPSSPSCSACSCGWDSRCGNRCSGGWPSVPTLLPKGSDPMPVVQVKILRDGVTADQKRQIVAEITRTLQTVLGKKPEHTHVIIDEVEPENWGYAGMLTTEWRQQQST